MSLQNVGLGMYSPVGWTNNATPGFATTSCAYNTQIVTYTASGSTALSVGFAAPTTWSNLYDLSGDLSGATWTVNTPGIYLLNVSQTLVLQNTAEITNPIVNLTINTVSETTTELNQILRTTLMVPITLAPISVNAAVSGIVCCDLGSVITFSIDAPSGAITVVSGANSLPTPSGYFSWNLIAQGTFGATGVIV